MSWWWWIPIGLAIWCVVAIIVGLIVGPMIRHGHGPGE